MPQIAREDYAGFRKSSRRHNRRTYEANVKIWFSENPDPKEFPKMRSVWLGHPKIVLFVMWILKKLGAK